MIIENENNLNFGTIVGTSSVTSSGTFILTPSKKFLSTNIIKNDDGVLNIEMICQ